MKKVAVVGLGAMGLPMACNLVKAGFDVTGFDVAKDACVKLVAEGGRASASARGAAQGADALLLMVVDKAQARSVLFDDGAAAALAPGGIVILGITCAPADAAAIAGELAAKNVKMVDAPVSGGMVGAVAGTLTIMAAADKATLDKIQPVFEAVGKRIFRCGDKPGQGAVVKAINQHLCGVHIAAAAEAMNLGQRAGLDPAMLLDVFSESAAASWMLKTRGPRMFEDNPEFTNAIDVFVKDLGIVLDAGAASKTPLPIAAAAQQLYLSASGLGLGRADDSQVIRAYRAMSGGIGQNKKGGKA